MYNMTDSFTKTKSRDAHRYVIANGVNYFYLLTTCSAAVLIRTLLSPFYLDRTPLILT